MSYPRNHKINVMRFVCMAFLVDGGPRRTVDAFLAQIAEIERLRAAKPLGRNWPHRAIVAELSLRGTSLDALAITHGIRRYDVNSVCVRTSRNRGITLAHHIVAQALGETVERVFPETVAFTPGHSRRAA